jgi:ceramide glucosyltransferase
MKFGRKRTSDEFHAQPVSVLKPLRGVDPELQKNIESFCIQDFPEYEVLLGFTDAEDDAIPVARKIAEVHKHLRVVVTLEDLGVNRKVSNLQGLIRAAKYPLVAISDSDMMAGPDYLRRIVSEYQSSENVGMVTSLYKISNPLSSGSALESLTLALDFVPAVLVAKRLEGITFGLGASMLLSKKALEDIGGFIPIADYLADDYQLGNRLWKKGYKLVLSDYVIEDVVGPMNVSDYLLHQIRWARTYRASRPWGYFGYGITHVFPFSLLLLAAQGPSSAALSALGIVLALRASLALAVNYRVIGQGKWLKWLFLLPFKDLLSFGIWVLSFTGRKVLWRGRHYLLLKGGKMDDECRRSATP